MNEAEQKLKGMGEQIKGKAREIAGAVTGDTSQEIKGKFEQTKGKVRSRVADTAEEIEEETGARI
jgi:uncharacterized protein YjbJ (UPF0337 family)